jgi:hypothetical protein
MTTPKQTQDPIQEVHERGTLAINGCLQFVAVIVIVIALIILGTPN